MSMQNDYLNIMKIKIPKKESRSFVGESEIKLKNINSGSFVYLWYFILSVTALIIISVIVHTVLILKNNNFRNNSFSILVSSPKPFLLEVHKNPPKVIILPISSKKSLSDKRIQTSLSLGIPIDGVIKSSGEVERDFIFSYINLITNVFSSRYVFQNVTIFDYLKIFFIASNTDEQSRTTFTFDSLSVSQVSEIFRDSEIFNEAKSIEVINATNVEGLAGKTAEVIKNLGGNIVSVTTAKAKKISFVSSSNENLTAKRISRLLQIPLTFDKTSNISDIQIVLGEDFLLK